jgi:hypothetical protein
LKYIEDNPDASFPIIAEHLRQAGTTESVEDLKHVWNSMEFFPDGAAWYADKVVNAAQARRPADLVKEDLQRRRHLYPLEAAPVVDAEGEVSIAILAEAGDDQVGKCLPCGGRQERVF